MSIPTLSTKLLIGHRTDVQKNAHYINDEDIIYPCGAALVLQNFEEKTQNYFSLPDKSVLMRLLMMSPRRNFLAVLDTTADKSLVHIYDLRTSKRLRTLSPLPDSTTTAFEWVCFSHDEKYAMVITGDPEWMMLAFNWERGKVESSTRANYLANPSAPVREVVCSPTDSNTVAFVGNGIFRLMTLQDNVWRQYGFQKAENFDITCCCFLNADRIICGTADGLLLLIELGELKYIFEADVVTFINARPDKKEEEFVGAVPSTIIQERAQEVEKDDSKEDRTVRALTPFSKGFTYSCRPGLVHFFEYIGSHKYKKRNVYEIVEKDYSESQNININTIFHLTINKSETKMIATTSRNQIYCVKLWGPEMDIAGRVSFKHYGYSIHTGPVGGLAVCYWKPTFMTYGVSDRTVRLWNYKTLELEMMKQYQEDIHSISMHPTGLFAAIGFSDKLRFVVVLIDDLYVFREFPIRECRKSSISQCGHLIAAVNRFIIQVYSVITSQCLANLKGHSGIIKSLKWTLEDKRLISCGSDGAIYEWDMKNFKRTREIVNKGVAYHDCVVTSNNKVIYAIGSDNYLKEIRDFNIKRTISLGPKNMRQIVLSRSDLIMFISDDEGAVVSVKLPLDEPIEKLEHQVHSSMVVEMRFSLDDRTLITCSTLGTICIWDLVNIENKAINLGKDFRYFSEILIGKMDLEEKLATMRDLTQRIHELEMEHAYQIRHTETIYNEKMKDIQDVYAQAIEELKATLEAMEANHNVELSNISIDMNTIKEKHEAEMLETEAKFNAELIVEYDKVEELERTTEKLTKEYEMKLEALKESKEKLVAELERTNESKLYNLTKMLEESREEIDKEVNEHDMITAQIEDDNDREVETLKAKFEKIIRQTKQSNIRMKGETGVLKKKILSSEKEIEMIQMEIIHLMADQETLKKNIKGLEQEISDLKKEIGERDLRIQDKEKRIYDLKRRDQEYERYKFVLNYRIKELKNQIEPRDMEIRVRKEKIAEMELQLDELQKVSFTLDSNLVVMRDKLSNVYQLLRVYKKRYNGTINIIKRLKTDIYRTSGSAQDHKDLKEKIKKLYMKYITDKDFIKAREGEQECVAELQRQNAYLQEIVKSLDKGTVVRKNINSEESMMYLEMNWTLMDEIYKIRKKLKVSQRKVLDLETLLTVRLTKMYSPREVQVVLKMAMKTEDEMHDEGRIQVEEASNKVLVMKEEIQSLDERLHMLEKALSPTEPSSKKKVKESLRFQISTPM